jgi:hypothetical protein
VRTSQSLFDKERSTHYGTTKYWRTNPNHKENQKQSLGHHTETPEVEQEMAQREGIFDVDTIPSPQIEPVSATLVEEEEQSPMMTDMEIDSHDSAQGHKTVTCRKPTTTCEGRSSP